MQASDVMTSPAVTVTRDMSVREVARLMVDRGISAVFVVNKTGKPIGVISEGDLLRRAELHTERHRSRWAELFTRPSSDAAEYVKSRGRTAKDVMTKGVIQVEPRAHISKVADLLESRHVKRVPVVHQDRIVGVVARSNLVKALSTLAPASPTVPGDRAIRRKVVTEIERHGWQPLTKNIQVRDGVVHLWGVVASVKERRAIQVAASNVPGVTQVKDHMRQYAPVPYI